MGFLFLCSIFCEQKAVYYKWFLSWPSTVPFLCSLAPYVSLRIGCSDVIKVFWDNIHHVSYPDHPKINCSFLCSPTPCVSYELVAHKTLFLVRSWEIHTMGIDWKISMGSNTFRMDPLSFPFISTRIFSSHFFCCWRMWPKNFFYGICVLENIIVAILKLCRLFSGGKGTDGVSDWEDFAKQRKFISTFWSPSLLFHVQSKIAWRWC